MEFSPHVDYEVKVCEQVLVIRPKSSWNYEGMKLFHERLINEHTKDLMSGSWGSLIDIRQWQFGTPYAMEKLKHSISWSLNNGMFYQAIIVSKSWQEDFYKYHFADNQAQHTQYFYDETKAWNWLSDKGLSTQVGDC